MIKSKQRNKRIIIFIRMWLYESIQNVKNDSIMINYLVMLFYAYIIPIIFLMLKKIYFKLF